MAGRGWNQSQSPFRVSGITNDSGTPWAPQGGWAKDRTLSGFPGGTDKIASCKVPVLEVFYGLQFGESGTHLQSPFRIYSWIILAGSPLWVKANSQVTSGFTNGNLVCVPIISHRHKWVLILLGSLEYGGVDRTKTNVVWSSVAQSCQSVGLWSVSQPHG